MEEEYDDENETNGALYDGNAGCTGCYRRAVYRKSYKTAQTIDWIRQIQMIYLDVCTGTNHCPFMYPIVGSEWKNFNREKLCQFNSQMCSAHPYIKNIDWYFYLYSVTETNSITEIGSIALYQLPRSLCRNLVNVPWTDIYSMQVQAQMPLTETHLSKEAPNGVITPQDKKLLRTICDMDADHYNFWIGFSNK